MSLEESVFLTLMKGSCFGHLGIHPSICVAVSIGYFGNSDFRGPHIYLHPLGEPEVRVTGIEMWV